MDRRDSIPNPEAAKIEIQMLEVALLDWNGRYREKAMEYYHSLLKLLDKPIYLTRSDE